MGLGVVQQKTQHVDVVVDGVLSGNYLLEVDLREIHHDQGTVPQVSSVNIESPGVLRGDYEKANYRWVKHLKTNLHSFLSPSQVRNHRFHGVTSFPACAVAETQQVVPGPGLREFQTLDLAIFDVFFEARELFVLEFGKDLKLKDVAKELFA